ncbi:hypothetical protein P4K96_03190, partial [Bacillus cereus]|nr:hypothetical protein [Bacillus cereus]
MDTRRPGTRRKDSGEPRLRDGSGPDDHPSDRPDDQPDDQADDQPDNQPVEKPRNRPHGRAGFDNGGLPADGTGTADGKA